MHHWYQLQKPSETDLRGLRFYDFNALYDYVCSKRTLDAGLYLRMAIAELKNIPTVRSQLICLLKANNEQNCHSFFSDSPTYEEKEVNGFFLVKQYNGATGNWEVAIYTSDAFKRRKSWLQQGGIQRSLV